MRQKDMLNAMASYEESRVRSLGDAIGYGRMMQLAERLWREKVTPDGHAGSEHTVGPCAAFMVPCPNTVLDDNGPCEICCGSGRVTKWVAENLTKRRRAG